MPSKVLVINDWSGGLVSDKEPRTLEDNELAACTNFDPTQKGVLKPSKIFKYDGDKYGDQSDDVGRSPSVDAVGYGLFVFSNDFEMDGTTAFNGEFIAKTTGILEIGATHGDIDILEVPTEGDPSDEWQEAKVTGMMSAQKAAFYAAEGDLFIGGSNAGGTMATPRSLMYHRQSQIPSGAVAQAAWHESSQDKQVPATAGAALDQQIFQATTDDSATTSTASGRNILHWIIRPSADADSGTWINNDGAPKEVYEYACSWVYKNNTESDLFELQTGDTMTGAADFTDVAIQVQAWYGFNGAVVTDVYPYIYGAKLYARDARDGGGDYYLLAEVSLEKGIKGDGETDWTGWLDASADPPGSEFDHSAETGDSCTTGLIANPPNLLTYKILNGFSPSEIPSNNRVAKFTTALVANSRAYIGNVEINGRFHGDRILKSPIFQYDVFTEDAYLEVAINDGDHITALAGYSDRILEFKRNTLYIINISGELEFLEDEHPGAGVFGQHAVTTTPFGVVWVNTNGCYLYDGKEVTSLSDGKISFADKPDGVGSTKAGWDTNVTLQAIIGYDPKEKQIVIAWDGGNKTGGYIFDAATGNWFEVADLIDSTVDSTNMVNTRGDNLVIGGGAAVGDLAYLEVRAEGVASGFSARTKVFDFGSPENIKNILEVSATYTGGHTSTDLNLSVDGGAFTKVDALNNADTFDGETIKTEEFYGLAGQSAYESIKTVQLEIEGTVRDTFRLYNISITYRDKGVRTTGP